MNRNHRQWQTNQEFVSEVESALSGNLMQFRDEASELVFEAWPIIASREIARAFGATNPPPLPSQSLMAKFIDLEAGAGSDAIYDGGRVGKRARQPAGFNYEQTDEPLVQEALKGMESKRFRSATDAARALASRAEGHGTEESKMKRLLGRIQSRSAAERN